MRTAPVRTITAGMIVSQLLGGQALAEPLPQSIPAIRAIFEQELFELAYTVFLANGNVKDALSVAQRAVKARPADKVWRKKAAQTAEWAGRADLALEDWFYLAQHGNQEARQSALRISRALQELPMRKQLLEKLVVSETADAVLQKEYLAVAEGLGLPQEAYGLLSSGMIRGADPVWQLTEQARLAELLGHPADAAAAWEKRAALKPLETDESLKLSLLWYGQGDTSRAWLVLKRGAETAPVTANAFWRTYADLAWALQKTAESAKAAELLIMDGHALEADYNRLMELSSRQAPERAYQYAAAGWKRFHLPHFWYVMADNGLRSGHARELATFLKGLTPDERRILASDARSWLAMSQVYRQTNNLAASLTAARVAMRLAPFDADLLSAYLWILVDLKQVAELRPLVRDWEGRITASPQLREPLAAALVLLGDTPRALRHYRILAPARQRDPAWLASYGDLLEQAGQTGAAWKTWQKAYQLVREELPAGELKKDAARTVQLTKVQLLMHLAPGDALTKRIRQIATDRRDDSGKELVMGWAMATGQTDLARLWYWKQFAKTASRPEWARLGLALEDNDRTTLADLLDTKLEQLPYRDAVEAAQRAGFVPLAQEHAWQHFQLNRNDYLLDNQVRELFGAHQGFVLSGLKLQDMSGVGWAESRLAVSQPLSNRYSLMAEMTERQFRLLQSNALGSLPAWDLSGGLTLTRRHEQGQLALSLGGRDGGFDRFVTAGLEGDWQLWHDLQLTASLEYNARTDETAGLAVAGTHDRARLTVLGGLTPNDMASLELATTHYHDQSRHYLGQGQSVGLDLRHQFTRAWPDYGVRLYSGYSQYTADGTVSSAMTTLVPQGTDPNATFFVPASFGHIGAGLFLGQTWKNRYTRDWKPFAEADVDWNSHSGFGFSYGLGMVGPVFGLDQLMLELSQGSGQFGTNDLNTSISITYRYFY